MLKRKEMFWASTPLDSKMLEAGASALSHGSHLTEAGKAMPTVGPAQYKGQGVQVLHLPGGLDGAGHVLEQAWQMAEHRQRLKQVWKSNSSVFAMQKLKDTRRFALSNEWS